MPSLLTDWPTKKQSVFLLYLLADTFQSRQTCNMQVDSSINIYALNNYYHQFLVRALYLALQMFFIFNRIDSSMPRYQTEHITDIMLIT